MGLKVEDNFMVLKELADLDKTVLEIASIIGAKKRTIEVEELYKTCISKLSYSKEKILVSIKKLYQKRILVEGFRLTKDSVLKNKKRIDIYEYIKKNPGAHHREIRNALNLGSYMAYRHLKYLEIFGFIRSKKFMNKKAYFLAGLDTSQDEKILLLRNERTKIIYDQVLTYEKIRLSEIENNLNLTHGQIQPHLKKLLDNNLISKIQENKIIYYVPIVEMVTEPITVKREFDYLGGNIRFKVAVQNNTSMSVSNIIITLNPSEQFFWNESVHKISNLPPHNSRGVDFTLIPNTCGKSTVFGVVSYQDAYGKAHSITINPKEIAIKCPLVSPQTMSPFEVNERIKKLKQSTAKINFGGILPRKAFNITLNQVEALDLSKVTSEPQNFIALYSGKVKVTGQQIVMKIRIDKPFIVIDVWANDFTQTTGILAFVRNLITIALEKTLNDFKKSEEVAKNIIELFNYNNELKNCFDDCYNGEKIKKITSVLSKIKISLEKIHPRLKILDPLNKWNLKLTGMYDDESCIDTETALELEYDIITWLNQIKEIVNYDIKNYEHIYGMKTGFYEDFQIGEKNIRKTLQELERLYGISILNYVIIIHKESGLAIYQENLGSVKTDADLISGFLTAIQNFGTEISQKDTSVLGLAYQNYHIEVETGDFIQAVLLLNGKLNSYLAQRLTKFVKEFERKYEKSLQNFLGNVSQFTDTKSIVHNIFGLPT
ncbi:MAG: hypothetical protein ACTSR3_02470 [Candidatus Helarchaeota archaeon]